MNSVILDASAALAVLKHERGNDVVKDHVPGSGNVRRQCCRGRGQLADTGMNAGEVRSLVDTLGLEVAPFDEELAHATGMLRRYDAAEGPFARRPRLSGRLPVIWPFRR